MRQLNQKVRWGFAVAAGLGTFAAGSQAATYTYTEATSTTTQWSAGTSWDAAPVSDPSTILTFGAGTSLAAGTAVVSNNDISGNFVLNRVNFSYAGPASGTAPTVTVTGNPLEFTGASAQVVYSATGAGATSRPRLSIDNDIVLSSNLTVNITPASTKPEVTLNGAITGSGSITLTRAGSETVMLGLSNTGNDYAGDTRLQYGSTTGRDTTLRLDASGVIPNGAGRGNLSYNATGEAGTLIVQLNGNNETINGLSSVVPGQAGSAGVHRMRNASATAATLTFGDNDTAATFVGTIENGTGAGVLSLNKIGSGTQVLSGVANHTGATTITDGALTIDYAIFGTALTANPANYFSSVSDLTMDGGASFAIVGRTNGGAISVSGLSVGNAARAISLPNAVAAQLVVGQELLLTKTDAGTATFTSGAAYVTAFGTPGVTNTLVYANKRLVSGSGMVVTVDTNATVATTSQTLKSLTLSGSVGEVATLDFGGSDNVTLLINAAPVQLVDGSLLSIANWNGDMVNGGSGDQFRFVGLPTDFSSVFAQSEVTFQGYGTGYSIIDFGGQYEVVPIPEPASLGLIGLAALAGLSRRRRTC